MLEKLKARELYLEQELLKARQVYQNCVDTLEQARANLNQINGHIQEAAFLRSELEKDSLKEAQEEQDNIDGDKKESKKQYRT